MTTAVWIVLSFAGVGLVVRAFESPDDRAARHYRERLSHRPRRRVRVGVRLGHFIFWR